MKVDSSPQFYTGLVAELYEPVVTCQLMQELSLSNRYACCYLAGASFCLMEDLNDAKAALAAVHEHLIPGGAFLISLIRPEVLPHLPPGKEQLAKDGSTIAVRTTAQSEDSAAQIVSTNLRYTRKRISQAEVVDRVWLTRWYTVSEMRVLLGETGFEIHRCTDYEGAPVNDDATDFTVVAVK